MATPLPSQLPVDVPGIIAEDGLHAWALNGAADCGLLVLTWFSAGGCSPLMSKLGDGSSLFLSL